jgi:hypothetical protein
MLYETGFFTSQQYKQFISHGSSYVDIDDIRYISIDFTLFKYNGIAAYSRSHDPLGTQESTQTNKQHNSRRRRAKIEVDEGIPNKHHHDIDLHEDRDIILGRFLG